MAGNTTRAEANRSFFIYVTEPNTDVLRRVAIPADLQVGLEGRPAELQLFGRLALSALAVDVTASNRGVINVSDGDTVVAVSLVDTPASGRISVRLPPAPRDGQVHFVKDATGTASAVPLDVIPADGALVDDEEVLTLSTDDESTLLVWLAGAWHVLSVPATSGGGGGGGGGAPTSASYVTVTSDPGLTDERVLAVGTGINKVDGGANSTLTLSINDGVVATLTGSRFSGPVRAAGGLSGSLQQLDNGLSYLVAGNNITITSQSNGQVIVSSTTTKIDHLAIVAGSQTVDRVVFQAVGAFEFNPTGAESMAPSGSTSYAAYFQPIVEVFPTGVTLETQLYNVGLNSYVAGSLLSSSLMTTTRLRSPNISGSLVTGSNVYEMHMRVTNDLAGKATCKGAKLMVVWS